VPAVSLDISQAFQPGATAARRIFVIHNPGCEQIDFPELAEDSSEVAMSENRAALRSLGTLSRQLGFDLASIILKDCSPDLERKILGSTQSTGNGSL